MGDYEQYVLGNNEAEVNINSLRRPSEQVLYMDSHADGDEQHKVWYGFGNESEWPEARHFSKVNTVFADGHAGLVSLQSLLFPKVIHPSPLELDFWKETASGLY